MRNSRKSWFFFSSLSGNRAQNRMKRKYCRCSHSMGYENGFGLTNAKIDIQIWNLCEMTRGEMVRVKNPNFWLTHEIQKLRDARGRTSNFFSFLFSHHDNGIVIKMWCAIFFESQNEGYLIRNINGKSRSEKWGKGFGGRFNNHGKLWGVHPS